MDISKYFLLLVISRKGIADQTFANFPWRNHLLQFQEKSWFAYALEIFTHSFTYNIAPVYTKQIMYVRISVYQFLKSSQTTLKSRCEFNNLFKQMDRDRFRIERRHMIVRPPLGSLGMDTWKQRYSKHRIECDSLFLVRLNKDFSYIWGFQLDLNLRLNLSFTKFFIKDVFTHCELGKMLLYNDFPTGIEDFRLCGRRHAFTHYSSSSSFFLEIQYKDTDPVEIYYVFSVFAKKHSQQCTQNEYFRD